MRLFLPAASAALAALALFSSTAPSTAAPAAPAPARGAVERTAVAPADRAREPRPPARMSTVGGPLLGRPGTQVQPATGTPALPRNLTARSWIVADAETGDVLAAHNAHWKLAPASTLKMLFADTLLPRFEPTATHRVTPADLAGVQSGSSLVGVKENLTYTVHDLWLGVFLRSGNDAVHVLCAMNGGVEATVRQMQAQADELQARDTTVVTPDGFDAPGQVSSAYDLTLIARNGLQKPDFRQYSATVRASFPGLPLKGGKRETFEIQNTNRLLSGVDGVARYPGVTGVKNGYTSQAGNTLTVVAERGGRALLVTVMHPDSGGNTVYKESASLLDWGFAAAGTTKRVGVLVPPRSVAATQAPDDHEPPGNQAAGPQPDVTARAQQDDESSPPTTTLVLATVALVLFGGALLLRRRLPPPAPLPGPGSGRATPATATATAPPGPAAGAADAAAEKDAPGTGEVPGTGDDAPEGDTGTGTPGTNEVTKTGDDTPQSDTTGNPTPSTPGTNGVTRAGDTTGDAPGGATGTPAP